MMNDETRHWAEEQDLLDAYFFNRMSPREDESYKRHLANCSQCTLRVQKEQQVIAGIKQYGRSQLRKRIKEHIEQQESTHIDRRNFLNVAAAIMLVSVTTIFFYWTLHHGPGVRSREIVLQEQHQSLWLIGKVMIKGEPFHGKLTKGEWTFRLRHGSTSDVLHLKRCYVAELPTEQQQQRVADEIPSLLERTAHGIELTVYLDDTDQSHLAGIEPLSETSFILFLEGKQIAYQIPDGWI